MENNTTTDTRAATNVYVAISGAAWQEIIRSSIFGEYGEYTGNADTDARLGYCLQNARQEKRGFGTSHIVALLPGDAEILAEFFDFQADSYADTPSTDGNNAQACRIARDRITDAIAKASSH